MDKTLKGISWIGNIYQKFEAVCLEVDDIVNQEAFKYVENQVQTVGSNVKQFCTEFMQDVLLLPLKDAEEEANMSLMQNTDISPYQDCCTGLHGDQNAKEPCSSSLHSGGDVCSDTSLEQSSDNGKCGNLEARVTENPVDGDVQLVTKSKSTTGTIEGDGLSSYLTSTRASSSVELTQCHKSDVLNSDFIPESFIESTGKSENVDPEFNNKTITINQEAFKFTDMCGNLEVGVTENPVVEGHIQQEIECKSLIKMEEKLGSSNCLATTECSSSQDLVLCHKGELLENDCTPDNFSAKSADKSENVDLGEINNKTYAINPEPLEVLDMAKLEESCIIVDGNEFYSLTNEGKRCRSYKKKLKEAFFSRRMLAKGGHELYERTRARCNQQKGNGSKTSILEGKSDSFNLDCGDSDWELV